ncbi:MAG: hypothetical protein LBS56_05365, partial [Propionibacteriaceae bacterium]|nr:hypothetical protein [Propionibacteriaceae bacterium]
MRGRRVSGIGFRRAVVAGVDGQHLGDNGQHLGDLGDTRQHQAGFGQQIGQRRAGRLRSGWEVARPRVQEVAMNQSPYPIVTRLNDDWARCATLAPDWPCRFGSTLAEVRAALSTNDPDAVLTELIAAAQAGSALAGRTVVQAFLGSLVRRCRRDTRVGIDEAVAALWLRLAAYPLDRRPRRIALNLMWDSVKDVLAENRSLGYLPVDRLRCDVTGDRVFGVAAELGLAS